MAERLEPQEVRRRMQGDDGALLVCAYNDTEKCKKQGIEESIPYPEFESKLDSIPKSKEIVFFCA
jgi:hypothetical protein